jgi:hypothetical protein
MPVLKNTNNSPNKSWSIKLQTSMRKVNLRSKFVTAVSLEIQVVQRATLHQWTCMSQHFEGATIIWNTRNYTPNDKHHFPESFGLKANKITLQCEGHLLTNISIECVLFTEPKYVNTTHLTVQFPSLLHVSAITLSSVSTTNQNI